MAGARESFSGVLQTMVQKNEESYVQMDEDPPSPPQPSRSAAVNFPRKMVVKVGKRRKKRTSLPALLPSPHTYVMKLFDKSVDLAQFDEDSPLYPICRAWMKNQPMTRQRIKEEPCGDSSDEEWDENAFMDDDTPRDINKLPPPLPVDPYQARVPPPVKADPGQILNIHQTDASDHQPEDLLLEHMNRWKETRNRWKDHAREQETRFTQSLNILKTMYDRQMKDA